MKRHLLLAAPLYLRVRSVRRKLSAPPLKPWVSLARIGAEIDALEKAEIERAGRP